jgi:hypothetical protein
MGIPSGVSAVLTLDRTTFGLTTVLGTGATSTTKNRPCLPSLTLSGSKLAILPNRRAASSLMLEDMAL